MIKRGGYLKFVLIGLATIILLLIVVNFFNSFKTMTGYATSGTTSLNISISNTAPTISYVDAISAKNPTDDTITSITFNFTASDQDGFDDINVSTAKAYFQRAGETTRSNTSCINQTAGSGNNINLTCTIEMWYFDQNGAWTINTTILDNSGTYVENSSTTFTYNVLTAMKMSPTSLTWPSIGVTSTNTGSDTDPIIVNNTGNDVDLSVNVTGYDLRGEITTTQFIYAANLSVENASQGCSGTAMANATSINVTSAIVQRGNHSLGHLNATSGQEEVYFCVTAVNSDLSQQSYSSSAYGAWTVEIIT